MDKDGAFHAVVRERDEAMGEQREVVRALCAMLAEHGWVATDTAHRAECGCAACQEARRILALRLAR